MQPQLTYAEYQDLGYSDVAAEDFAKLERQAQRAISALTGYYYDDHEITEDKSARRVDSYKVAICEQVDYISATGNDSSYANGDDFKAISIGRLSMTPQTHVSDKPVNGVCYEAYSLLAHAGLLYRGRGSEGHVASYS